MHKLYTYYKHSRLNSVIDGGAAAWLVGRRCRVGDGAAARRVGLSLVLRLLGWSLIGGGAVARRIVLWVVLRLLGWSDVGGTVARGHDRLSGVVVQRR